MDRPPTTTCAGCQRPITDGEIPVQYRETIGLQEWVTWTYHAACAPAVRAEAAALDWRDRSRADPSPPLGGA